MATGLPTRQFSSEAFVESCGAILFDLADPTNLQVCLVQARDNREWHLAKGRRNYGESRKDAAIREVMEETGFRCRLFPVTMPTRAPPPDSIADFRDKVHVYNDLIEPFMCTTRQLKHPKGTRIIWWYIAALDQTDDAKLPGEVKWIPQFFPCEEAIKTLKFQNDREIVARAVALVEDTFAGKSRFSKEQLGTAKSVEAIQQEEDAGEKADGTEAKELSPVQDRPKKGTKRKKRKKDSKKLEGMKRLGESPRLRNQNKRAKKALQRAESF